MSDSIRFETVVQSIAKQAGVEGDLKCGICGQSVRGIASACGECHALYHADCWRYNGGCAVYGCRAVPHREPPPLIDVRRVTGSRARKALIALGAVTCLLVGVAVGFHGGYLEAMRQVELEDAEDAAAEAAEAAAIEMSLAGAELMHAALEEVAGARVAPLPPAVPAPVRERIARLPLPPAVPQVLVETLVAELDEATARELGVEGAHQMEVDGSLREALGALERRGKARLVAMPLVMGADGEDVRAETGDLTVRVMPQVGPGRTVKLVTLLDTAEGARGLTAVVEAADGQEQLVACVPAGGAKRLVVLMVPHLTM